MQTISYFAEFKIFESVFFSFDKQKAMNAVKKFACRIARWLSKDSGLARYDFFIYFFFIGDSRLYRESNKSKNSREILKELQNI